MDHIMLVSREDLKFTLCTKDEENCIYKIVFDDY